MSAGCDYVLHSTSQLLSHKRKHERREIESIYRKHRPHHSPAHSPAKSHAATTTAAAMLNPTLQPLANQSAAATAALNTSFASSTNHSKDDSNDSSLADYLTRYNQFSASGGAAGLRLEDTESTSSAPSEAARLQDFAQHEDELAEARRMGTLEAGAEQQSQRELVTPPKTESLSDERQMERLEINKNLQAFKQRLENQRRLELQQLELRAAEQEVEDEMMQSEPELEEEEEEVNGASDMLSQTHTGAFGTSQKIQVCVPRLILLMIQSISV